MDAEEREIIKKHKHHLEKSIDYNKLIQYFHDYRMFNQYMWEDIRSISDVLDLLPTRGPKAFRHFVEILRKVGYGAEADVLEKSTLTLESSEDYYKMSSVPLGYCLIINNMKFNNPKHRYRKGSEVDAKSLADFFKNAEFEVEVVLNLTSDQMKKCIENFSKKEEFKIVDSMFLIIMSHGGLDEDNKEVVYGKDGGFVYKDDIYDFFSNKNKNLLGKPKVFFFVACRGKIIDTGVSLDSVPGDAVISKLSDILIINSCPPKCVSERCPEKGTYFCQALVSVLNDYYKMRDLESIIKLVNRKLVGTVSEGYRIALAAHGEHTGWRKNIMLCRKY